VGGGLGTYFYKETYGRGTFGVSAGGMGAGVIGGEVDFGYNPSFFGTQNDFGNNSVLNVMRNLIGLRAHEFKPDHPRPAPSHVR
jgi:hypothetical protein